MTRAVRGTDDAVPLLLPAVHREGGTLLSTTSEKERDRERERVEYVCVSVCVDVLCG
jgi:hypothetical protein